MQIDKITWAGYAGWRLKTRLGGVPPRNPPTRGGTQPCPRRRTLWRNALQTRFEPPSPSQRYPIMLFMYMNRPLIAYCRKTCLLAR